MSLGVVAPSSIGMRRAEIAWGPEGFDDTQRPPSGTVAGGGTAPVVASACHHQAASADSDAWLGPAAPDHHAAAMPAAARQRVIRLDMLLNSWRAAVEVVAASSSSQTGR